MEWLGRPSRLGSPGASPALMTAWIWRAGEELGRVALSSTPATVQGSSTLRAPCVTTSRGNADLPTPGTSVVHDN